MIFNFIRKPARTKSPRTLSDIEEGCSGILTDFDLNSDLAEQLMNLGFVPGLEVAVAQSGPGGDPRVYRVDGTEVALRSDLSRRIRVTPVRPRKTRGRA